MESSLWVGFLRWISVYLNARSFNSSNTFGLLSPWLLLVATQRPTLPRTPPWPPPPTPRTWHHQWVPFNRNPPPLTQRMDAWGCGAENTGITGAQKSNPHLSVYHNLIRVSDVALATEHSHIQIRTFLFSLGGTLANVWSQRHLSGAIGWGARFLLSDNGWLPQLKANRKLVLRVLVINSQLYSFV